MTAFSQAVEPAAFGLRPPAVNLTAEAVADPHRLPLHFYFRATCANPPTERGDSAM